MKKGARNSRVPPFPVAGVTSVSREIYEIRDRIVGVRLVASPYPGRAPKKIFKKKCFYYSTCGGSCGLDRTFCLACGPKGAPFAYLLVSLQRSAKTRGITCSLTESQLAELFEEKKCFYCEASLPVRRANSFMNRTGKGPGSMLDRKKNSIGYHKHNLVSCCGACNIVKNSFRSEIEMLFIMAVRKRRWKKALVYGRLLAAECEQLSQAYLDRHFGLMR